MDASRLLRRLTCALALGLLLAPAGAAGQAMNDNFETPFGLSYGEQDTTQTNAGATVQSGEVVTCNLANGGSTTAGFTLWWDLIGSGRHVTLTTSGSNFDSTLSWTTGSLADTSGECDDGVSSETLEFDSEAGTIYHIQVGGCVSGSGGPTCGAPTGRISLLATTPPPANDNRGAAQALTSGTPLNGDNIGATEEPGEVLSCNGAPYGRSVWYSWHASAPGRAIFTASGPEPVLSVYRSGTASPVQCAKGTVATGSRVEVSVTPGDYLLQVAGVGQHDAATLADSDQWLVTVGAEFTESSDRDGDGVLNSQDCAPDNPAIHPGATDIPGNKIDEDCSGADGPRGDRDGDGTADSQDCAPDNPKVHPGAIDIPGNRIDENCSAGDASLPLISASARGSWLFWPTYTVVRLRALDVPAGSRIEVRCGGPGCPFRRWSKRVRRASSSLGIGGRKLARAHLRRGAILQVRITKTGMVGRLTIFRFSRLKEDPTVRHRCLSPGSRRAVSCGS